MYFNFEADSSLRETCIGSHIHPWFEGIVYVSNLLIIMSKQHLECDNFKMRDFTRFDSSENRTARLLCVWSQSVVQHGSKSHAEWGLKIMKKAISWLLLLRYVYCVYSIAVDLCMSALVSPGLPPGEVTLFGGNAVCIWFQGGECLSSFLENLMKRHSCGGNKETTRLNLLEYVPTGL